LIHLGETPDDYAAILSFAGSALASALALKLRQAQRSELTLAPAWPLSGSDALELRLSANDGSVACYRLKGSLEGIERIPIVDAASLEAVLPPAAARAFASALELDHLQGTVSAQLG
jgi:hypothetical protein